MSKWTDTWIYGWMNQKEGSDKWMDVRMDGWMDWCKNGWMDGCMDRWIDDEAKEMNVIL